MYNIKWQEDRIKAILLETEQEARREESVAAIEWEAQLVAQAVHPEAGLVRSVMAAQQTGHWPALRQETEAKLRAAIEAVLHGMRLSGGALSVEEIARRIARVQILVAEGADDEAILKALAVGMGGVDAQLVTWRCVRAHTGLVVAGAAPTACPICGAHGAPVKTN